MKLSSLCLIGLALSASASLLFSQHYAAPPAKAPDEATLKEITAKIDQLGAVLGSLRRQGVRDPILAEVEIYHKAATWVVRHNEFYQPEVAKWTLDALSRGLLRARLAAEGSAPWLQQAGHAVIRAYRSRVDGSVQPFAVTLPAEYGKNPGRKWRVDVVLHGRDPSLTEVKFLHQHAGDGPAPKEQDWVQLDIYGRGNNAYRWAGETDVIEAMDSFLTTERLMGRDTLLDPQRFVLRGFSMGGAGTWELGLHTPGGWCVIGPGAGFVTTHGYLKDLPEKLPAYQEACLHIYDAADYAENAFDVPVVAYDGANDPQLQAARTIEARLKPLHIPMTLLVAPGLAHKFPPEWQQKAEKEYARHVAKGRPEYPERVHFVTYTLKYPSCFWVDVLGLERHYHRALVDAERTETGFTVKTANVRALNLTLPAGAPQALTVNVDTQEVHTRPNVNRSGSAGVLLEKRDGRWKAVLPSKLLTDRAHRLQKLPGLQGPIDDAFTSAFLCVRGTGKAWHEHTQQYAEANLARFRQEWDKYLRGDLPVKDDIDVTEDDILANHLILFGDPSSNSLLAQVVDDLPLQWNRDQIKLGGKTYDAAGHVPALVYPSPLNANRLVVLNSGHTFHAADLQGSNALLYPRLGDYAILKLAPTDKDPLAVEVATAGLFDDFWQLGKQE